jgi:hypothetical protein
MFIHMCIYIFTLMFTLMFNNNNKIYFKTSFFATFRTHLCLFLKKFGTIVHSRCLTLAESNVLMLMSMHGLTGKLLEGLQNCVSYLVSIHMQFQM